MHPSKRDLKDYLSNKLEDKKAVVVKEHLESCEFCQELLENMKLFEESMQQVVTDLPPRALRQANQLYIASLKGKTIEISPLFDSEQPTTLLLAADGAKEPVFGVENISTLFSEDPGLILGVEPETANVVDSAPAARRLLDEMRSSHLQIVLDAANLLRPETVADQAAILDQALDLLGDDLVMAHAKDITPDGRHVAAGTGVLDYAHYMDGLLEIGFAGPLILHGLAENEVGNAVGFVRKLIG